MPPVAIVAARFRGEDTPLAVAQLPKARLVDDSHALGMGAVKTSPRSLCEHHLQLSVPIVVDLLEARDLHANALRHVNALF